jgi:uncharacterized protein
MDHACKSDFTLSAVSSVGAIGKGNPMYFNIYRDHAYLWRWTLLAANHRKIADSGESYTNEADCLSGIGLVMGTNSNTPVYKK